MTQAPCHVNGRDIYQVLPEAVFEQRWQFFRTEAFAGPWVRSKVFRITEQGDWKWSPAIERDHLLRYLDRVEILR